MMYVVNDQCIGCGLCVSICPKVFSMGADGLSKAADIDAEGAVQREAEEALASCPVNAIQRDN